MRLPIPLQPPASRHRASGFLRFQFALVSYVISLEQIVITNPASFVPPFWPPRAAIALIHWWEKTFDPLLWARPAWYRATIWIDVLLFGPFYAVAIYAFARGREWIRLPSVLWAGMMLANVTIILFDELLGAHASPHPMVVLAANASWLVVPMLVLWRMARKEHPFTEEMPHQRSPRNGRLPRALRPLGRSLPARSVGLGEAFARQLAGRGLNLLLLARGQAALDALAADLRKAHGIEVRTLATDLARPDLSDAVASMGRWSRGRPAGLQRRRFGHRAVSRSSRRGAPARHRRELPRPAGARAPLRQGDGRAKTRRHRAHDLHGRLARRAVDCDLRGLQSLQPAAGRGAVGRACGQRRACRRLPRRRHAHAWLRGLETSPQQGSVARPRLRRGQDACGPRPRPQRRSRDVLPTVGVFHGKAIFHADWQFESWAAPLANSMDSRSRCWS